MHSFLCNRITYVHMQEEIALLEPCIETADEVVRTEHEEGTYNLSPPKALFSPSPNHPLHILVQYLVELWQYNNTAVTGLWY